MSEPTITATDPAELDTPELVRLVHAFAELSRVTELSSGEGFAWDQVLDAAANRLNGQGTILASSLGALWLEAERQARKDWQIAAGRIREREDRMRKDCLAVIDRLEADLGFTAPELYGMRFNQAREAIASAFESVEP
jgi:hypothetical protein